ncbi:MAG: adenine phosphoribosyltransferase [Parasphingorhabdus sp.]|jgi:adenine phosphoribosyltransferase
MDKTEIKKFFKCAGTVVLPVIHVLDNSQVEKNVAIALQEGAAGVFLINHDFSVEEFLPIIRHVRSCFPSLWLGVNFLAVTGKDAFPVLAELKAEGCFVDGYWADDACIDESSDAENQTAAQDILDCKSQVGWDGIYFGGTAFKKQRPVKPSEYQRSASIAASFMDVVTTSGQATGSAAEKTKVEDFYNGVGNAALALASGVTPENIDQYAAFADVVLVATGINYANDFYNIEPWRLRSLIEKTRLPTTQSPKDAGSDRDRRWYLSLMAPRSRGEKYAWLDPSAAYINARSFHDMLDDLLESFAAQDVDVFAGFDAAGFVLGGAMATRLGKGFLTIRKGGKIPVVYDTVPMMNYSGQTQAMEMRKPAFAPGTRVILVDQWIETGGTMNAGIELVERQNGIVAGIAAVCVEENAATDIMKQKYKVVSCVVPGSAIQSQCNAQTLDSFKNFKPEDIFP